MTELHEDADHEDTAAEAVRQKLAQLKLRLDTERYPYRLEKMFPKLDGWGAKGQIKGKVKLIKNVEPFLEDVLRPNEEVLYVAKGVQHSAIEAMTIGALWANMINQTVFILTNVRLIMAHSNSSGKPRHTCWMIYYSEITKFKASFTGVLDLRLADGKRMKFTGFSKLDRKSMPQIFEEALELFQQHDFVPECTQSREDLCGRCYEVVPKSRYACDKCGTRFWTPGQLALRSLIFPAWGDFLMKHYALACFELFGLVFTWFLAVAIALNHSLVEAALVVLLAHGFDALGTYFVAKKGLHPAGRVKEPVLIEDAV